MDYNKLLKTVLRIKEMEPEVQWREVEAFCPETLQPYDTEVGVTVAGKYTIEVYQGDDFTCSGHSSMIISWDGEERFSLNDVSDTDDIYMSVIKELLPIHVN